MMEKNTIIVNIGMIERRNLGAILRNVANIQNLLKSILNIVTKKMLTISVITMIIVLIVVKLKVVKNIGVM